VGVGGGGAGQTVRGGGGRRAGSVALVSYNRAIFLLPRVAWTKQKVQVAALCGVMEGLFVRPYVLARQRSPSPICPPNASAAPAAWQRQGGEYQVRWRRWQGAGERPAWWGIGAAGAATQRQAQVPASRGGRVQGLPVCENTRMDPCCRWR